MHYCAFQGSSFDLAVELPTSIPWRGLTPRSTVRRNRAFLSNRIAGSPSLSRAFSLALRVGRWKPPTIAAFLVDAGFSDAIAHRALQTHGSASQIVDLATTPVCYAPSENSQTFVHSDPAVLQDEKQLLADAADALARAAHLPIAAPSLFEFRTHNRLAFYSFVNFYLSSPRVTLLYALAIYGPSGCAGYPGLRDLSLAEALLWPQLAAVRLLRAFAPQSPVLSTVGVYAQLAALITDWAALLGFLAGGWSLPAVVEAASATARQLATAVVWRVLWPILPWWVCDLVSSVWGNFLWANLSHSARASATPSPPGRSRTYHLSFLLHCSQWFAWLYLSTTFTVAVQLWGQLSTLWSLIQRDGDWQRHCQRQRGQT